MNNCVTTYVYADGESAIYNASVGFYTDENGGNYISIECWGYGGHELTFFEEMLEPMEDGPDVKVISSDEPNMGSIEGYYNLESELNLSAVG